MRDDLNMGVYIIYYLSFHTQITALSNALVLMDSVTIYDLFHTIWTRLGFALQCVAISCLVVDLWNVFGYIPQGHFTGIVSSVSKVTLKYTGKVGV